MFKSFLVLSVSLLALTSAFAQSDTTTATEAPAASVQESVVTAAAVDVVATVNGEDITFSEVKLAYQNLPAQYKQLPVSALQDQLVDRLIEQKILVAMARKKELEKSEDFIKKKKYLVDSLLEQIFLTDLYAQTITDENLDAAYQDFLKEQGEQEEIRARHILLKTKEDAQAVITALDDGADFPSLAKEKSTGPTGPNGGDLGYFQAEQMVAPFADAAFACSNGSYSKEPVQTQFGWHVILTEDRRKISPPTFDEVKETIAKDLQERILSGVLDSALDFAEIERFPIPKESD